MSTAAVADRRSYHFDLSRCAVFDLEAYPGNRWCVGFYGPRPEGDRPTHSVADGDRNRLARMLHRLHGAGRTIVGYNSQRFDVPLLRAILAGHDPYPLAQSIIATGDLPPAITRLPLIDVDHIDLSARLRRGGSFASLKVVSANLGRPTLRELPYPPDAILGDEEWAEVLAYNRVDLENTWALLERFAPELQALAALSEEQGRDLRSVPTPKVVERVFVAAYHRRLGSDPIQPESPREVIYRPAAGVRRPRTPEAASWYDKAVDTRLPLVTRGPRQQVDVPRAHFRVGRMEISVGAGGLHSIDKPRVYYATRKRRIVSVDVASFYPSLIAAKGIAPRAYGDVGADTYRGILKRRLEVKRRAKEAADPDVRRRLEIQADSLKLIVNSFFGKLGDPYSTLYDPAAFVAVTIAGQLMLIDLIERLIAAGVRVLSANTDGLFLRVRREDRRWRRVLAEWQTDTEMTLEVEPLRRLAVLASNRYATLDGKGVVKRKGDGLKGSFTPVSSPNSLVVADAVASALLRDVPLERTIGDCTELVRFCRVTRRTAAVTRAVLVDEADGSETDLPKVTRWYKARGSTLKIRHDTAKGHHTTPTHAVGIRLALDLPADGGLPEDLDKAWYVAQARKVVQTVPGYRHRSRRLLLSHAPAIEALERGLVPCPKRGKAQPAGADAARPTYLYDWPSYPTVGTYTGPATGLLVLDVDDPKRFRAWIDKNDSPLFQSRWKDLDGCLVSVRGETTADDVRRGRGRGKLIFRFEAEADHPLARLAIERWKKDRGVEVFYGKGIPSVLGQHPDGESYRLDGTLGTAPEWLIEGLLPKGRLPAPGTTRTPDPVAGDGRGPSPEPAPVAEEAREGLLAALSEIDPRLGRSSVGWRSKELDAGRVIWVGRCPYEHDSGTSSDGDLAAGFDAQGRPYLRCKHASCAESQATSDRLKESHPRIRPAEAAVAEPPAIEPTAITRAMLEDLDTGTAALHVAPTGSGKSHSIAQAAALRYRLGLATLVALPTIRLAEETFDRLREFAPEALEADAVAAVYGGAQPKLDDEAAGRSDQGEGEGDGEGSAYPIQDWSRIVVCTHAQLGRRGFSKFLRGIWAKLRRKEGSDRPAFALVIDEAAELLREARWEVELAHRTIRRGEPDGSGGILIPRDRCPKYTRSGNCANCRLVHHGGVTRFNKFGIRELVRPPAIEVAADGTPLRQPRSPLALSNGDLKLGGKVRVGHTTFASPVLAFRGRPIDVDTRRTAPLYLFKREKDDGGRQPLEAAEEVLGHLLEFALRPVVTWEHPIDPEGERVESGTLALRIRQEDKRWDEGIVFPMASCEVPRLRFTDLLGLEKLRRYAEAEGVGVVLAGATLGPDDAEVLRAVWPGLAVREHPYPNRKIRQAAVVAVQGYRGADALIGRDKRLIAAPLERHGLGLVFCATRDVAEALHKAVARFQPTAWLAVENVEQVALSKTLHHPGTLGTYVTYSRGVLGLGANVLGIRHLVVDAMAFRSIASFTPGEVTPEAFLRSQAEERLALILQNVGRALRGEPDKTVALIVLNADDELMAALHTAPAILQGCERPPAFAAGRDLAALIDQADRWLAAGGGEWPEPDPAKAGLKPGRPKGSRRRTPDEVILAAEEAIATGTGWREFRQKHQPQRTLGSEEVEALKARFGRDRA